MIPRLDLSLSPLFLQVSFFAFQFTAHSSTWPRHDSTHIISPILVLKFRLFYISGILFYAWRLTDFCLQTLYDVHVLDICFTLCCYSWSLLNRCLIWFDLGSVHIFTLQWPPVLYHHFRGFILWFNQLFSYFYKPYFNIVHYVLFLVKTIPPITAYEHLYCQRRDRLD